MSTERELAEGLRELERRIDAALQALQAADALAEAVLVSTLDAGLSYYAREYVRLRGLLPRAEGDG